MSERKVVLVALVGLVGLFAGSACDLEQATEQSDEQGQRDVEIATQETSASEADAARAYWTPERMEAAEPLAVNGTSHEGDTPPSGSDPSVPGAGVSMEQTAGSTPETASGNVSADASSGARAGRVMPKDTVVYQGGQVSSNYTQYPYRTVGKVFFTKNEREYSCSASVIASENRSVVWTAGHCVAERGNEDWHDNWIFVPAYKNTNAPLGKWAARVKATIVGWYSNGNRSYDMGAVVVEEKDNQPIAAVTGSLGWMFNAPRDQDWRELGYPGAGNLFNGETMWECFAPYAGGDGGGSSPGPVTSKIEACDMTAGASGGPWVVSFENCPQCYINGANSWWWWQNDHFSIGTQWATSYHGSAGLSLLRAAEGF